MFGFFENIYNFFFDTSVLNKNFFYIENNTANAFSILNISTFQRSIIYEYETFYSSDIRDSYNAEIYRDFLFNYKNNLIYFENNLISFEDNFQLLLKFNKYNTIAHFYHFYCHEYLFFKTLIFI